MENIAYGRNASYYEGRPWVERNLMHYSSSQSILLVGEGDFSFSSALASAFKSAGNIIATSLDSEEKVYRVYNRAPRSIWNLQRRRAIVMHGVDATRLQKFWRLRRSRFDRIVFNLPHAGYFAGGECSEEAIKKNNELISKFFKSAKKLLSFNGQIHVTNKVGRPYEKWNLKEAAENNGLYLKESVSFQREHYPGYINRRGSGAKINRSFYLGRCITYMFCKKGYN